MIQETRDKQTSFDREFMTSEVKMITERYADARLNDLLKLFIANDHYKKVGTAHKK